MIEVIFGVAIGLGIGVIFPDSLLKIKTKVLELLKHRDCH